MGLKSPESVVLRSVVLLRLVTTYCCSLVKADLRKNYAKYKEMGTENLFDELTENLFEKLCETSNLHNAFLLVKRNKGAAGVDGLAIADFERNLEKELQNLSKELKDWHYKPQPVKRVEIPKADGKSTRQLGIPTVRDRVVQSCLKGLLEPIFDPAFSSSSFGFRPGRSQRQALEQAKEYVAQGNVWIVDIDLAKFFDTISHDRLIYRLSLKVTDKRILRLVGLILRSGVQVQNTMLPTKEGSVQGSPLSPLLSNIVLDELDKELEERDLKFCRWADDCNIYLRSEAAAKRVMGSVTKFIESKLRLKVNTEKSKVAHSRFVKFLGMTIIGSTLVISARSMTSAFAQVRQLIPTNSPIPVQTSMYRVNQWYIGWAAYHSMASYPRQLIILEAHIRRRFRARLIRQCKYPKTLYRRLVKQGVTRKTAARNAWSNHGPWKLSHMAADTAWSTKWFINVAGQKIYSNKNLEHWKSVKSNKQFI